MDNMGIKYSKEFKDEALRVCEREGVRVSSGFYGGPVTERKPREIYERISQNRENFSAALCCIAFDVRRAGYTNGRNVRVPKNGMQIWYRL